MYHQRVPTVILVIWSGIITFNTSLSTSIRKAAFSIWRILHFHVLVFMSHNVVPLYNLYRIGQVHGWTFPVTNISSRVMKTTLDQLLLMSKGMMRLVN
jgi:hypothetical protein